MSASAATSLVEPQSPTELAPASAAEDAAPPRPAAVLKGGPRGLEFLIDGTAPIAAVAAALCTRLAEAPAFFRGSSVCVRVEDGPLAPGCLARIDEIATRFELSIVEVGASRPARPERDASAAVSAPVSAPAAPVEDTATPQGSAAHPAGSGAVAAELAAALPAGDTRIVVGPVRSGVILEHHGNLVVVGDVNPGAEVRAERNIIVLGRLRGIAHAGIGRDHGFILALKLEPQQLRIARQVARAGDADGPVAAAEIAYVTSNTIVVERYAGKLPLGLANSM
ncbi:MAG: septum site-determining protein MinC [Kofleriaceae bacterium]